MFIPDPRWEEPSLLIPGKKPTGPVVIDWSHPLARGLEHVYLPSSLLSAGKLLTGGSAESIGGNSFVGPSVNGEALKTGSYSTNDGVHFPKGVIDFEGITSSQGLSLLFVVSVPSALPTSANEATLFRQTDVSGKGLSLSIILSSPKKLRGLINTTGGTSLWTAAYDYTFTDWLGKYALIGMVWRGGERHLYIGEIGSGAALVQSATCTGVTDVETSSGTEYSVIGGGENSGAYGFYGEIYMAAMWYSGISSETVSSLSRNPYQFLCPQ